MARRSRTRCRVTRGLRANEEGPRYVDPAIDPRWPRPEELPGVLWASFRETSEEINEQDGGNNGPRE